MEDLFTNQIDTLGIKDFLIASEKYTKEIFPNIDFEEVFNNSLSGDVSGLISNQKILNVISNELKLTAELLVSVLIIVILHSLLKSIIENLGNTSSGQVVYFVQYLLITTVIINYFINVLDLTKGAISDVISFMNLLIPLLITLMLTTGVIATTSTIQPILLIMINFIGSFVNTIIIPMLLISITISIVSNVSDKVQINRLAKFFKSSIVWILGIVLTIFTSMLSIEGTLSSSVDGLTAKTAKAAVSNFIPVVGKIMGDSVDTVIGCGNILKNAVGMIGVFIIIGIVLVPVIKIMVLWISFRATAALCEVIADDKITKLLDQMSDTYRVLLAILFSISIMFIIGITIVIKITNGVLMYR